MCPNSNLPTIPSIKFSFHNSPNRIPPPSWILFTKVQISNLQRPNQLIHSIHTLLLLCHPPSDESIQTRPSLPLSSSIFPPPPFASCSGREDTRNQQQNLTGLKFRLERKWISRETGDVSGGRNIWKWQSFSARRGVPLFERQICR